MKCTFQALFIIAIAVTYLNAAQVAKTYTKPVFMHYMPWWDTPEFNNGNWGGHWKMSTKNPETIVDDETGRREVAAHYYPLIGTYDSEDTVVIENHLLLMKYSGVDGVLINWYGESGTNGDVGALLQNSNAIVSMSQKLDMQFSVIMEDRFSDGLNDLTTNITYLKNNYFSKDNFITFFEDEPFFGIFGPITVFGETDWNQAMEESGQETVFLTLPGKASDVGVKADGEYDWVSGGGVNDSRSFYENKVPSLFFSMGGAYPGFHDYYVEGGWGDSYFYIAHNDGDILRQTLDLAIQHQDKIEALQLITWNDYGEGTMFEPTVEFGYQFLTITQDKLGVSYEQYELEQIHRLYVLRKEHAENAEYQIELNAVRDYFVALDVDAAVAGMDNLGQGTLSSEVISSNGDGNSSSNNMSSGESSSVIQLSSEVDAETGSSNSCSEESQSDSGSSSQSAGSSDVDSSDGSVVPINNGNTANVVRNIYLVNGFTEATFLVPGATQTVEFYTVSGYKIMSMSVSEKRQMVEVPLNLRNKLFLIKTF